MKKTNFFRHFVETLQARSLLGMLLLAPLGASAQVTIGSGALPQATLDIVGTYPTDADKGKAFRLDDGNQAPGKVLTCQDNGIGTWKLNGITILQTSLTNLSPAANQQTFPFADYPNLTAAYVDSLAYIDLAPGKYLVLISVPIEFDFRIEAFERADYSVGFHKEGVSSPVYSMQRIHSVYGPIRENTVIRQIQTSYIDTSSETSTTRYYVCYLQFRFYNENGVRVAPKEGNVIINRSGYPQSVFCIPENQ